MRLYFSPGACSLAPHIVAREAWITVERVKVDLATKTTATGEDYRTINPKGSVPALRLDDGVVLTEAAVICQFLADLEPETGLMPAPGTVERYRALEWFNFVATELHKGFSPLWRRETPAEMRSIVRDVLATKFDHLEKRLTRHDFLLGDDFAAPDAYAFTILSWTPHVGIDLKRWPAVLRYVRRVSERPSVRAAFAAEGLLEADRA